MGPRWYAQVAAAFDTMSAMPLVLEPDTVEPLYEQAFSGAEATVMEPGDDSPETIEAEAAERTAMAVAILAYGPSFLLNLLPKEKPDLFTHFGVPKHHDYLIARFDITELTDEERGHLAIEISVQAERSENHPSVPNPELKWEDDGPHSSHRRAVDLVQEAYFLDQTVSNEAYGRLMEEAVKADQAREWDAEVDPATDEEIDRSFDAYR